MPQNFVENADLVAGADYSRSGQQQNLRLSKPSGKGDSVTCDP